jgi:hypothetical protein
MVLPIGAEGATPGDLAVAARPDRGAATNIHHLRRYRRPKL